MCLGNKNVFRAQECGRRCGRKLGIEGRERESAVIRIRKGAVERALIIAMDIKLVNRLPFLSRVHTTKSLCRSVCRLVRWSVRNALLFEGFQAK